MIDLKKEIQVELDLLVKELIEAYNAKGMKASGNWADSLEVEVTNNSGKIKGLNYSEQLEYGRSSGGFPPIDQIEQWIQNKGIIPIEESITIRTLAFLIARKIAREGWNRNNFGGVELISQVLTPERISKSLNNIAIVSARDLQKDIIEMFTVNIGG